MERSGVRLRLLRQQAQTGDIDLLYGDESEALTHPYLARCWAPRGADLRIQAPGQAKRRALLGAWDPVGRQLLVHTSATKRSGDFIALLDRIVVDVEVSEEGHAAVHHGFALGDDDRLAPTRPHPMALSAVVAFQRNGLVLALIVLSGGEGVFVGRIVVGTDQPGTPALKPVEQAVQGGFIPLAALPVDQAAPVSAPDEYWPIRISGASPMRIGGRMST